MTYKLTIERIEVNPAWDAEAEKEAARRRKFNYGNDEPPLPPYQLTTQVLNMEMPEEMFNAIRKAALEVCK